MASWNLIICSDIQRKPDVIHCPDPTKWTVRQLRSEAAKKLGYPEEDLTLYCNETILPEGKPLTECKAGLKNGVALLVKIKPSTVNVFCPHIDATLRINIPRREWDTWTVATLRTVVCFKLGIDPASYQNDILALEGVSLFDLSRVCDAGITCTSGKESLLTYTRIQEFQIPLPSSETQHIFPAPSDVSQMFASGHSIYDRDVRSVVHTQSRQQGVPPSYPEWLTFWTITVQQLDGTKTSIKLPDINRTPIYKLRELVKEALAIPTHQQKLTLGGGSNNTIVLEDWDQEGGAMVIAHYPSLHDGATLYLVQLTEGIHVKVQSFGQLARVSASYTKLPASPSCRPSTLFSSTIPLSPIPLTSYINIHSPSKLRVNSLKNILCNFNTAWVNRSDVFCQSTGEQLSPSDAPVASVKWIVDGCTLAFTKPILKIPMPVPLTNWRQYFIDD